MSCIETQRDLENFLEGRLSGGPARRMRAHLAACPTCAALLAPPDWAEILPAVDEVVEPAEDLRERFHARLSAYRRDQRTEVRFDPPYWAGIPRVPWPRQLASVGVLAACLIGGIYVGLYRIAAPGPAWAPAEMTIAEDLPLLQDMDVIKNLDLLEEFDEVERLPSADSGPSPIR
jgi:anti-sigma factor RsiW